MEVQTTNFDEEVLDKEVQVKPPDADGLPPPTAKPTAKPETSRVLPQLKVKIPPPVQLTSKLAAVNMALAQDSRIAAESLPRNSSLNERRSTGTFVMLPATLRNNLSIVVGGGQTNINNSLLTVKSTKPQDVKVVDFDSGTRVQTRRMFERKQNHSVEERDYK